MSRMIKQGGVFVALGGAASPSGDALPADVFNGKTFESSAGTGQVGTSSSNATVPSDAAILPVQAYVDYAASIFMSYTGNGVGVTAPGLSHLDLGVLFTSGSPQWNSMGDFNFSSGSLPTTDIDALLMSLASSGGAATLDISGANMGVPTPVQSAEPVLIGAGTANVNGAYAYNGDLGGKPSYIKGDIIIYWSTKWEVFDNNLLVLLYDSVDDTPLPWDATFTAVLGDSPAPTTQLFDRNADITLAIGNGANIIVMEWVNRNGPQVLVSGAGVVGVNGIYRRGGLDLSGRYTYLNPYYTISYSNGEWGVHDLFSVLIYTSTDDTAEPWDAVFTSVDPGDDPAPSLTFVSGSSDKETVNYI